MPQLDFSIWMMKLMTCWLMFFLVYSSTKSMINNQNIDENSSSSTDFNKNNWPW